MNLEFFVRDQKITRKGWEPVVGDTAGFYTFSIEFDAVWEDLVKVVVFRNGEDTAQMIYTGQSPLPASVSGRGDLYVACHGYRKKDDAAAVIRTIRMTRPVRLLGADPMVGDDGKTFTPTLLDQVLSSYGDAKAAARSAQDAAKAASELTAQLQQMVEQGAFHGTSATVVVERVQEGDRASVVNVGTEQDVRLHITLPRGSDGETGIVYSETEPQAEHHPLWVTPSDGVLWVWQQQQQCYEPLPMLAGKDGYTPVKGTDYYTEAEQEELVHRIAELVETAVGSVHSWNDLADKPAEFPPETHSHSYTELTDLPAIPDAYTHPGTHPASMISAGTFAGEIAANSSGQTAGSYVLRNSKLSSAEESPTVNGQICWKYE